MNEHTINVVQLVISLPAELLGFSLALIEIRFPSVAQYFRASIVEAGTNIRESFFSTLFRRRTQSRKERLANIATFGLIFVATLFLAREVYRLHGMQGVIILYAALVGGPLLVIVLVGPVLRLGMQVVMKFVTSFAEGHEIGTMGLIIACVGIIAESVQAASALHDGAVLPQARTLGTATEDFVIIALAMLLFIGIFIVIRGVIAYRYPRLRIESEDEERDHT